MRTEARIPDELAEDAKALVNHLGHQSFNDILNKALKLYLDQFKPDIERIKREQK